MSDEFIRVATKEINDELTSIHNLVATSHTDADIENISHSLEKHLHKIKGLAPMMGKEDVGKISSMIDNLMKQILRGNKIPDIYSVVLEASTLMKKSMTADNYNVSTFIDSIGKKFPESLE